MKNLLLTICLIAIVVSGCQWSGPSQTVEELVNEWAAEDEAERQRMNIKVYGERKNIKLEL